MNDRSRNTYSTMVKENPSYGGDPIFLFYSSAKRLYLHSTYLILTAFHETVTLFTKTVYCFPVVPTAPRPMQHGGRRVQHLRAQVAQEPRTERVDRADTTTTVGGT